MNNLFNLVSEILKTEQSFISQDWDLLKTVIREKAEILDENLISLLLKNTETKKVFFKQIWEITIFDNNKFIKFINNKEFLPNSYTSFKNKIWLVNNAWNFIANSDEVVLNFPYKDCVLAWWQNKDEQKREEIFYNEILWSDDIDVLLDKKVFTNFKRINKDWEHKLEWFNKSEEWTITDNLIIKWNNLLALHSLKSNFAWKVKLIYIDPPYNTWNDSFKYNDKFNHSTWLTFMKNRLEIAKELLSDDWVIFISIDDNEQAYLKILMDEIFLRDNFLANIIWHHTVQWKNDSKWFSLQHNSTLCFQKSNLFTLWKVERTEEHDKNYSNPDNDINWKWRSWDFRSPSLSKSLIYDLITPSWKIIKSPEKGWRWNKETISNKIKTWEIIFNLDETKITRKIYLSKQWWRVSETLWLSKEVWTSREWTNEIKELFNSKIFDTPKPEKLLKRIIEISTNPWDIVLDYHLWSWTTCAVAHKMWRQYIGIEQMDYIENISVERMKKVIEWEQGWISKSIGWQGWWEFIYMEITQDNEIFIKQIIEAWNIDDLKNIYEKMKESSYISYNYDIDNIEKYFNNLNLDEETDLENLKTLLIDLLDKNMLYVNYSEIEDENNKVSEEDKRINKEFYKN